MYNLLKLYYYCILCKFFFSNYVIQFSLELATCENMLLAMNGWCETVFYLSVTPFELGPAEGKCNINEIIIIIIIIIITKPLVSKY